MDTIHALVDVPDFNFNYSITNFGTTSGIPSTTKFYWSANNIFDLSDINISSVTEGIFTPGNLSEPMDLAYPEPITQVNYFLFYKSDANDTIVEHDETDNVGSFIVKFNYVADGISSNESGNLSAFVYGNQFFVQNSTPTGDNKYMISLIDNIGNTIIKYEATLSQGINIFDLPDNIAAGLYFVILQNHQQQLFRKIIIQ